LWIYCFESLTIFGHFLFPFSGFCFLIMRSQQRDIFMPPLYLLLFLLFYLLCLFLSLLFFFGLYAFIYNYCFMFFPIFKLKLISVFLNGLFVCPYLTFVYICPFLTFLCMCLFLFFLSFVSLTCIRVPWRVHSFVSFSHFFSFVSSFNSFFHFYFASLFVFFLLVCLLFFCLFIWQFYSYNFYFLLFFLFLRSNPDRIFFIWERIQLRFCGIRWDK
jgi:hypothetical protein